ncbi:DUF4132 domain-containing protein [Propionibacteriaceae bacterium G1746]|uniref:DUF4132 domain-containing protein n=1 Tax=Aestuariimicrobium sp. G57 TaxID=3418485 RepID=UPI003C1DAE9B
MKRRLSLTEGTSDKFWYIDAAGTDVTVRYGRRGTDGTTKTKTYPSPDEALRDAEKQVSAKLKKGYSDEAGAADGALTPVQPSAATPTPAAAPRADAQKPVVVPEPAETPAVIPDPDLDAGDIGLVCHPVERAWAREHTMALEHDTSPFDPQAEAALFDRITSVRETKDSYWTHWAWQFSEYPFTAIPGPERAAWWRDRLDTADAQIETKRRHAYVQRPLWLQALLAEDPVAWLLRQLDQDPQRRNHPGNTAPIAEIFAVGAVLATQPPERATPVRQGLRTPLPAPVEVHQWNGGIASAPDAYIAAALGHDHDDEIAALLAEAPRGAMGQTYVSDGALVALLGIDAADRVAIAKRLSARLNTDRGVVPWLVATGSVGFGLLVNSMEQVSREDAGNMMGEAVRVLTGPGAVPFFLDSLRGKAAQRASQWLTEHPAQLLAAHLSMARAEAASPFLRQLPVDQLRAALPRTTAGVNAVIAAVLAEYDLPELDAATGWWAAAVSASTGSARLPKYLTPAALPPLLVGDHRLSADQSAQLLAAMAAQRPDDPLLAAAREHIEPASRDRFAVAALDAWLAAGAPAKDGWLMTQSGVLGGDRFVHHLTPMIREWPGLSQHKRAVNGLDALRNVGSDTALQSISGIAAKVKFAALKKRAGEAMEEIADARGMTRDQLEDRVVPDGGLDERGRRVFDFGPRQFVATITPEAKVVVRDLDETGRPTGKPRTALPAPNKSDDEAAARLAKEEFTVLKKTLTGLAKTQASRFERAMISGRRWSFAEHQQFIARQPVLRGLLAALLWGVHDRDDTLVTTVRMDEEGLPVDPDDEPVEIAEQQQLSIAHPLDLDPGQRSRWGEVLADYELVAPFKQLDRPVFTLPAAQDDGHVLLGLPQGVEYPAGKLFGAFAKYGWQRGMPEDAGVYSMHARAFESANLTAVIEYSGMWMGPMSEQEDQEIRQVTLVEGVHDAKDFGWGSLDDKQAVPWRSAPPAVVSEVLATIDAIIN